MSQVREAAERLRKARTDGESSVYSYADPLFFMDRTTIIDAYLDSHPADDGEEIDWQNQLDVQIDVDLEIHISLDEKTIYVVDYDGDSVWLPRIQTKGQLRRLIQALKGEA